MQFAEFARAHGLLIRDLRITDKIQRCPTVDHPRSTNGAYFFDGRRGWIQRWDAGDDVIWWEDDKPWTEADKAEWDAKKLLAAKKQQDTYQKAAERAQTLIKSVPVGTSPYLSYKGVKDTEAHVDGDVTVVPMRDYWNNNLTSVQFITWNAATRKYDKKFLPGGKTSGAVFKIGRGNESWFCEGFATGKSIAEALNWMNIKAQVVCTFSAHNLVKVAKNFKGRGFVFADHDSSGVGAKAAQDTGLPWMMCPKEGQDANDYHQEEGLLRLCKLIQTFQMSLPLVETVDSKPAIDGLRPVLSESDSHLYPADGFVRSGNTRTIGTHTRSL
jgi:phage/plasmid primase-like uncharacterized protein